MKNNLGALLLWISNKLNKNQAELVTKIDHIQNLFKTAGEATATPADMLEGQTAYNGTALITGTMPDQGAKEETLIAGETYNIPRGYHDGEGTVTATDLASQTPGSASSVGILTGLEAWVAGEQITGTMPDKRATTVTAAAVTQDDEYTYLSLPEGEACYSGSSKVRALNSDLTYKLYIPEISIETYDATTLDRGSASTMLDVQHFTKMTIGSCEGTTSVTSGDVVLLPENGIYNLTGIDTIKFRVASNKYESGVTADPGGQFANYWRKSVIKDIYLY